MGISIKKVVIILFITMVTSFFLAFTLGAKTMYDSGVLETETIPIDNTLSQDNVNDITKVSVSSISSNVNIIPAKTNSISAHYYGTVETNAERPLPELKIEKKGNTLKIYIDHPKHIFHIGFNVFKQNTVLDITVPDWFHKNLDIKTISGNTKVTGNYDELKFETVSGTLKNADLTVKNTKITSISGNINLKNYNGEIEVETISGNINIEMESLIDSIKMTSISGSFDLELPEDASFDLDYESVSGDLDLEFDTESYRKDGDTGGARASVAGGKHDISVETVSGSLDIERR